MGIWGPCAPAPRSVPPREGLGGRGWGEQGAACCPTLLCPLPAVDYFTWLHEFHAVCDVFVIVMLLASIAQFRTKDETHLAVARALNFLATWVLPVVIAVTWMLFFTVFRGDSSLERCTNPNTSALEDGC